jgi:hypothetical protein
MLRIGIGPHLQVSAVAAARDMLIAQALAPTFVFIGYGVVKFFTLGTASMYWLDTYLAVGGGIVSWIAVFSYDLMVPTSQKNLLRMLCVYGGFIPLLYSLYAVGYLGIYTIYYSIFRSFSVLGIIFGLISVLFGYRMAYGLQGVTERPRSDPDTTSSPV